MPDFASDCLTLRQIQTRLPASEASFVSGTPAVAPFLAEVMQVSRTTGLQGGVGLRLSVDLNGGFQTGAGRSGAGEGGGGVQGRSLPPTSPFLECILSATICGRTVSHRKRSLVDRSHGDAMQDLTNRHQWLNSVLTSRIESLQATLLSEPPNASVIFAALMANLNILGLCETVECMPVSTEESHTLLVESTQRSAEAVQEISTLITALAQFNQFQVIKQHALIT